MSAVMSNAALAYAARLGWPVFPQHGKAPAIRGGRGYLDATTDAEAIRQFWARFAGANIGVSCIASGFVALDVDPRYGGDETLAELESRYRPLPQTPLQRTGGGGLHLLFRAPRNLQPRGSIGVGVEVKWRGSVTVSPSVHPETGCRYAWALGHHPLDTPIAEPPAWLVDLLMPDAEPSLVGQARPVIEENDGWGPLPWYSRAALERACEAIEGARAGEQHKTLNSESYGIGGLIGAGLMPRQLAIDCLIYSGMMMSNAPGRRRWHAQEVKQKVVRAVREGERHPREVTA